MLYFLLEYDLIKRGYYCKGKEPYKGRKSIKACADACRGSSALFIIGTNEFGNNRCYKDGCKCYCQYATQPHCLVLTKHTGYDLYAFNGNGNCLTKKKEKCVFPFKYKGVVHNSCTTANNGGKLWCSTGNGAGGNYKTWGNCDSDTCGKQL